tara:strand:+ start:107 stop:328 length:222 start_codon:yes stop_codon:yes gene_type:complete
MRKEFWKFCLSLAAPALVCLGILGFFSREGSERVQALPALFTGIGLISSSAIGRNIHRRKILNKILHVKNDLN